MQCLVLLFVLLPLLASGQQDEATDFLVHNEKDLQMAFGSPNISRAIMVSDVTFTEEVGILGLAIAHVKGLVRRRRSGSINNRPACGDKINLMHGTFCCRTSPVVVLLLSSTRTSRWWGSSAQTAACPCWITTSYRAGSGWHQVRAVHHGSCIALPPLPVLLHAACQPPR